MNSFGVDHSGNLYVAPREQGLGKVHVLSPQGALVWSFGFNEVIAGQGDFRPCGVCVKNNRVYVGSAGNGRIYVFEV